MKHGKKYTDSCKLFDKSQLFDAPEALELAVKTKTAKFDEKVELQKRFAAAYGKSASFAEVVFVFENFRGDSACGNHPRAVGFSPGIGIVTIFASEIAPL